MQNAKRQRTTLDGGVQLVFDHKTKSIKSHHIIHVLLFPLCYQTVLSKTINCRSKSSKTINCGAQSSKTINCGSRYLQHSLTYSLTHSLTHLLTHPLCSLLPLCFTDAATMRH